MQIVSCFYSLPFSYNKSLLSKLFLGPVFADPIFDVNLTAQLLRLLTDCFRSL